MNLCVTVNNRTNARRFYVNGRRVTRDRQDAVKLWRPVHSFQTITKGDTTRHYCNVSD